MANAQNPWFRFWARDWLGDEAVMTMSCIARGAFIQLLCCEWENGSLPDDVVALAMLSRIHNRECAAYGALGEYADFIPQNMLFEQEIWPELESRFPLCEDGRRRNPKLEQQRTELQQSSVEAATEKKRRYQQTLNARLERKRRRQVNSVTDSVTDSVLVCQQTPDADADVEEPFPNPSRKAGRASSLRSAGKNPRALGTNPRAQDPASTDRRERKRLIAAILCQGYRTDHVSAGTEGLEGGAGVERWEEISTERLRRMLP